jgi:hypothetical protein
MISDKQFKLVRTASMGYGCGYGDCKIKQTPNHIIFEFYNAGWSLNEEEDMELKRKVIPEIDDHPITIYAFRTAYLDKKSYEGLETIKIKSYRYKFERD